MQQKKKYLFFLEYIDEIPEFIAYLKRNKIGENDYAVVAFSPSVQAELSKKKILYYNTLPFLNNDDHEFIIKYVSRIYTMGESIFYYRDIHGASIGYKVLILRYLRVFLVYILQVSIVAKNAVRYFSPDKLVCYGGNLTRACDHGAISENSRIIRQILKSNNFRLDIETFGTNRKKNQYLKRIIKYIARLLLYYIVKFKFIIFVRFKKYMIAPSESYKMGSFIKKLLSKDKSIFVCYLSSVGIINQFKCVFSKRIVAFREISPFRLYNRHIVSSKHFFERFSNNYLNIIENDLHENNREIIFLVKLWLKKIGKSIFIDTVIQSDALIGLMNISMPKLILSQYALGVSYTVAEVANLRGIDTVLVTHGSHVPTFNKTARIEWYEHSLCLVNTCHKYLLLQTPWVFYYIRSLPNISSNLIKIEPFTFSFNKKNLLKKMALLNKIKIDKDEKIILHAGTPKHLLGSRLYIYETIDEYIFHINEIIRVIERLENTTLLIRFRPLKDLTLDSFNKLLRKSYCYKVVTDLTLSDYLNISDILISYSSTTIEEALNSNVPVIQFDLNERYMHIPATSVLENEEIDLDSIYYVSSSNLLMKLIYFIYANKKEIDKEKYYEKHKLKTKSDPVKFIQSLYQKEDNK